MFVFQIGKKRHCLRVYSFLTVIFCLHAPQPIGQSSIQNSYSILSCGEQLFIFLPLQIIRKENCQVSITVRSIILCTNTVFVGAASFHCSVTKPAHHQQGLRLYRKELLTNKPIYAVAFQIQQLVLLLLLAINYHCQSPIPLLEFNISNFTLTNGKNKRKRLSIFKLIQN